jgi:hypothetical protein
MRYAQYVAADRFSSFFEKSRVMPLQCREMGRRLFTMLSVLSLVLCLATVALWVRSHAGIDNVWFAMRGRSLIWFESDC